MIAFMCSFSDVYFFTDCTPDLYVQLPYQVYYVNPGDQRCVVCNSTVFNEQRGAEAFVSFVHRESSELACPGVPGCVVTPGEDTLCFNEGIPESSFGDYLCRHSIIINSPCEVPFTIAKAGQSLSQYLLCLYLLSSAG